MSQKKQSEWSGRTLRVMTSFQSAKGFSSRTRASNCLLVMPVKLSKLHTDGYWLWHVVTTCNRQLQPLSSSSSGLRAQTNVASCGCWRWTFLRFSWTISRDEPCNVVNGKLLDPCPWKLQRENPEPWGLHFHFCFWWLCFFWTNISCWFNPSVAPPSHCMPHCLKP